MDKEELILNSQNNDNKDLFNANITNKYNNIVEKLEKKIINLKDFLKNKKDNEAFVSVLLSRTINTNDNITASELLETIENVYDRFEKEINEYLPETTVLLGSVYSYYINNCYGTNKIVWLLNPIGMKSKMYKIICNEDKIGFLSFYIDESKINYKKHNSIPLNAYKYKFINLNKEIELEGEIFAKEDFLSEIKKTIIEKMTTIKNDFLAVLSSINKISKEINSAFSSFKYNIVYKTNKIDRINNLKNYNKFVEIFNNVINEVGFNSIENIMTDLDEISFYSPDNVDKFKEKINRYNIFNLNFK